MDQARRDQYLQQLGITQYRHLGDAPAVEKSIEVDGSFTIEPAAVEPVQEKIASAEVLQNPTLLDWPQLQKAVKQCQSCELYRSRKQVVFGDGDENARLLIISEAPGIEEDKQGLPFVGVSGDLLNSMLWAIGFTRQQVYITNTIKCSTPGNRKPGVKEVAACRGYLENQIALVKPDLILAAGGVAAHSLLETEEAVSRLRGKLHYFGEQKVPVLVTYHPAYLLRRPEEKSKSWEDLQQVFMYLNAK